MKAQLLRTGGTATNPHGEIRDTFEVRQGEIPALGVDGVFFGASVCDVLPKRIGVLTTFPRVPVVTTPSAVSDPFTIKAGTNAGTYALAAAGGLSAPTGATSGDQAIVTPYATGALRQVLSATNKLRFAARVSLSSIAAVFGSFGLNENVTDPDPSGTAGDGAMFLADPADVGLTVDTGLTAAQHLNWILHTKVNDADVYQATSIPINAGQDYILEIQIGTDLKPLFYIDGVYVGAGATALTSGDSVSAWAGIETGAAAAKTMDLRYISLSRELA